MKRQFTIAIFGCAILGAGVWLLSRSTPPAPQSIRFAGFTNGVVGLAPVFGTLHTNYAATIQRWMDAGTNVVEFTITNQQSCAIWLFPVGRICTGEAKPNQPKTMNDDTPIRTVSAVLIEWGDPV